MNRPAQPRPTALQLAAFPALLVVLVLAVLAAMSGCAPSQVQGLKDARAATTQALSDTKADAAALQAQLDALPPDAPERKVLQPQLDRMRKATADIEARIPLLDKAIASAQSGHADPALVAGVSNIPYVGPYLSAALILGPAAWGLYENYKKRRATTALTQVVKGVDAAMPIKTDEQRLQLSAAQDESTKALVAKAKKA